MREGVGVVVFHAVVFCLGRESSPVCDAEGSSHSGAFVLKMTASRCESEEKIENA